jgi:hypothetical protein
MVNSVVLAGAIDEHLSDVHQGPAKALVAVCATVCVQDVLEALRGGSQSQDAPGQACRASTDHSHQGHMRRATVFPFSRRPTGPPPVAGPSSHQQAQ